MVDLAQNPTYVILDLRCTKSMGSRYAVNKFMKADHVYGLEYELIPSTSRFACANSETTSVHQALNSCSQRSLRCSPTVVDNVEQGSVPILLSLQQMKNLQMQLDMRPDRVLITREALVFHHVQANKASSSHIVIDLVAILSVPSRTLPKCESDFHCLFVGD